MCVQIMPAMGLPLKLCVCMCVCVCMYNTLHSYVLLIVCKDGEKDIDVHDVTGNLDNNNW